MEIPISYKTFMKNCMDGKKDDYEIYAKHGVYLTFDHGTLHSKLPIFPSQVITSKEQLYALLCLTAKYLLPLDAVDKDLWKKELRNRWMYRYKRFSIIHEPQWVNIMWENTRALYIQAPKKTHCRLEDAQLLVQNLVTTMDLNDDDWIYDKKMSTLVYNKTGKRWFTNEPFHTLIAFVLEE